MIATCQGFATHALAVDGAHDVRFGGEVLDGPPPDSGLPMADLRLDVAWS